jgi:hypothetical protein
MGNILRSIYQDSPINNEIISSTTISRAVKIGKYEGDFAVQVIWDSGASLDVDVELLVSNVNEDGTFSTVGGSSINSTDSSGAHIWDITSGAEFMKVKITINSGSANFRVYFNGKSRV